MKNDVFVKTIQIIILFLVFLSIHSLDLTAMDSSREFIVKLETPKNFHRISEKASKSGAEFLRKADHAPLYLFEADTPENAAKIKRQFTKDPSVEYVQKNHVYQLLETRPNDLSGLQWGLHNPGGFGRVEDADIDAPEAWDYTTGTRSVIVAVTDSGTDIDHPDLVDNLWVNPGEIPSNEIDDDGNGKVDDIYGWNFWDEDNNVQDEVGHGAHVGGVIGAVGNNDTGLCGTNWRISIMSCKSFKTNRTDDIYLINAIDYAIQNRADIINASWSDTEYSQAMFEAVKRARDAGILFMAASGNDGADLGRTSNYPAAFQLDNVLSVGAMNDEDMIAGFSNYNRRYVHLMAPGESIRTTTHEGGYAFKNGTSFAAPFVSGVAGLLLEHYPEGNHNFIRGKILGSVERAKYFEDSCMTNGRLNAYLPFLDDVPDYAAPQNLNVRHAGFNGAILEFDLSGLAGEPVFDVRISNAPITGNNFFDANIVHFFPVVMTGTTRRIVLYGLDSGETYHAALKILDQNGNYSPVSSSVTFQTESPAVLYSWDVETEPTGWIADNPWKRNNGDSNSGDYSWSIGDWEGYPAGLNVSLQSPVMDLSGAEIAFIEFYQKYHFPRSSFSLTDYGILEMSINGGAWETIREFTDWYDPFHRERFLLKDAAGKANVRIRFRFVSDDEFVEDYQKGWYIDDIRIISPTKRVALPRRFYVESFRRFNRLHDAPEYVEQGGGWTSIPSHNTTDLFGKESTQARGNSLTNGVIGKAIFSPFFPADGLYRIHAAWGLMGNAENVSFIVNHDEGSNTVLLDQDGFDGNEDQWHALGVYPFSYGRNPEKGSVAIDESSVTGPMQTSYDGMISFDLIRFEMIEQDIPSFIQPSGWMLY